jgi:hypothetical protein
MLGKKGHMAERGSTSSVHFVAFFGAEVPTHPLHKRRDMDEVLQQGVDHVAWVVIG